jgi:hypothetical protein
VCLTRARLRAGKQINQETGESEDKPPLEQMSRKDVMKFPIYGSCVLFGLYCLFKFNKELANMLLGEDWEVKVGMKKQ